MIQSKGVKQLHRARQHKSSHNHPWHIKMTYCMPYQNLLSITIINPKSDSKIKTTLKPHCTNMHCNSAFIACNTAASYPSLTTLEQTWPLRSTFVDISTRVNMIQLRASQRPRSRRSSYTVSVIYRRNVHCCSVKDDVAWIKFYMRKKETHERIMWMESHPFNGLFSRTTWVCHHQKA